MPEDNNKASDIYSADDPLDINELASLNDDISVDFIEQLQNQVALNASQFTGKPVNSEKDDTELFEEVSSETSKDTPKATFDDSIDDNFIKKYKAKINKQHQADKAAKEEAKEAMETKHKAEEPTAESQAPQAPVAEEPTITPVEQTVNSTSNIVAPEPVTPTTIIEQKPIKTETKTVAKTDNTEKIDDLTSGNIIEKPIEQEQIDYNESLDYLDDNVKYSKYVIYIDPENTDFIESLTVKERKNLINRILREQDDIALTKKRLGLFQTIIKHSIIATMTIAIAIPCIYWTVNASLEASINNYRRSQTLFKTMYKDKGKIRKIQP